VFAASSALVLCSAEAARIDELKAKLPEIFAKSAAHYKALDAAATPLMKKADGTVMVPQGFKRNTRELDMRKIEWWTSGHYPGSLWYLYEATGDDSILEFIDEEIIEGLKMYHDTSREPYGYSSYITADKSDRFYDDNIWLVIDFVDLYNLTKKQHYLDLALDIWNFVLSGRDTVLGDGIYWCEQKKDTKNTCSNAPAAVAALKLHKATGDKQYFDQGENLYTWVLYSLRDKDNLYFDNVSVTGKFDRRKFTYNSGQMIEAGVLMYEATGDKKYYDEAQQTVAACVETWVKKYTNDKEEEIYIVESGDVWFDAVMLRGFLALWRVNQTDMLLEVYHDTLNYAWYMGRDENGLFGKYLTERQEGEDKSWLLTQAAYVEMSARLAAAQNSKVE
jgi:hypothetical protein